MQLLSWRSSFEISVAAVAVVDSVAVVTAAAAATGVFWLFSVDSSVSSSSRIFLFFTSLSKSDSINCPFFLGWSLLLLLKFKESSRNWDLHVFLVSSSIGRLNLNISVINVNPRSSRSNCALKHAK